MSSPVVTDTPLAGRGARPNVLAMPSATVSRFVLLLTALLSSGLFVGTWIHNETPVGQDWLAEVSACQSARQTVAPDSGAADILSAEQAVLRCVEGAQQRLAWYAVGGVGLTLVAGCVLLVCAPTVIVRRRRLRPAGAKLAAATERVAALSGECGLGRVPTTMIGPSTLRDGFSFGVPYRYAIALPPALAVRSRSPAFDPLVRHELAHVARHDVLIAWSARALWYVVGVALSLPVGLAIAQSDLSLLPSYLWRGALLLSATLLASAGILRSREYDADLGSARTAADRDALSALLEASGRGPATGWRRLLVLHPDASQRVAVLADPSLLARPSAVDSAVAGLLAAMTAPLLVSLVATVPSLTPYAYVLPAVVVGPVIGATVGLSLWRVALVDRVTGSRALRRSASRAAAAVAGGFFFGQAASLASVGSGALLGFTSVLPLLLGAVAVGGTTFVVAGLGALAGARSANLSARSYTSGAVAGSALLFAFVLWASTTLSSSLDLVGWSVTAEVAVTALGRPAATAAVAVLAMAVLLLLLLRTRAALPSWAVEGDGPAQVAAVTRPLRAGRVLLVALVAGIVGSVLILAFRVLAGPAETDELALQRFEVYLWVFAGVGAAAGLTLLLTHGLQGTGAGLLAVPFASATAALGFVVVNTAYGGAPSWEFVSGVVAPGLPVGVLLFVLGAPCVSLPLMGHAGRRPLWLVVVVAALLAGLAAVAAVPLRNVLSPVQVTVAGGTTADDYINSYAPSVEAALSDLDRATAQIDADSGASRADRARRIRSDLVAPLDNLLRQAASMNPVDAGLVSAHVVLIRGLQGTRRAFDDFATAYETNDATLFAQAQSDRAQAHELLHTWMNQVDAGRSG